MGGPAFPGSCLQAAAQGARLSCGLRSQCSEDQRRLDILSSRWHRPTARDTSPDPLEGRGPQALAHPWLGRSHPHGVGPA